MSAALTTLIGLVERASITDALLITAAEVRAWPEGVLTELEGQGILHAAAASKAVACPECPDGHWSPVIVESYASGPRAFIRCPDLGRVEVSVGDLDQWRVDLPQFATVLAAGLGERLRPEAVAVGGFLLGRLRTPRSVHDVLLQLRPCPEYGLLEGLASPIVVHADGVNPPNEGCVSVALRRVLAVTDGRVMLDVDYLRGVLPSGRDERYVFRRVGDYWCVVFEGVEAMLKHQKGMDYLHQNLASADADVHVTILTGAKAGAGGVSTAEASEAGLALASSRGLPALDPDHLRDIKRQLREKSEERREAEGAGNADEIERLDQELEVIQKWYRAQVDRTGRPRQVRSDTDRMRTAVTKAITAARVSIRENLPDLDAHLGRQLTTGEYCRYRSMPEVTWSL